MNKVSAIVTKPQQFYKGLLIKADYGLHDQLADIIKGTLMPGARILDFGAGEGALSQRLADLGYNVYSVDLNAADFKAETTFECLDFNDTEAVTQFLNNHKGEFDMVLGIEVIEHVENPWEYLRNLKMLAKPQGYILLSTPNVTSWYSRVKFFFTGRLHQFEDHDRVYGHINPIAEDELIYICDNSELKIVNVFPGGWLPRLWLSRNKKQLLLNIFGFLGSFFMKGKYKGWCLISLIQRI